MYLYTTHDEEETQQFQMQEWLLYTSTDMVNWQDCGAIASLKDFKWCKTDNGAWASQVVFLQQQMVYVLSYLGTRNWSFGVILSFRTFYRSDRKAISQSS